MADHGPTQAEHTRPSPWAGPWLRVVLPSALTLILFTVATFAIILPAFEANILDRKREMLKELTQTAVNTLAYFQAQEKAGLLTRRQAQDRAKAHLRADRYGEDRKDYFWINDLTPRMIMHPYRPDLEGHDISDFKDPQGKRLFVEMVEAVKKDGHGYVDYMWQWKDDPAHIVPKVSYVEEFKPWSWIVGTGIYVEDVAQEIAAMTGRLTLAASVILAVIALLTTYVVHQNLKTERERRRAEDDLLESQRMLRLVMDNIPQLIYWKDRDLKYLGCNQSYARLAGLESDDQVRGRADLDLPLSAAESSLMLAGERQVMQEGRARLHQIEPRRLKDGGEVWLDASRIPLKDAEGQVVGILCTYEDITESRRTEQALMESEHRFRALVENVQVGICILQEGRAVYMNPEQRRLFGDPPGGVNLADFDRAHAEDLGKLARLAADDGPLQDGPKDLELRLFPQGRLLSGQDMRWVHCRASRVEFQGQPAALLIMLDITQGKELEHLLRLQDKMASLGRVAAGIAHEIRNPLSGINMYLSALEGMPAGADPSSAAVLAKIKNASAKIEGVIKRVLDFSKPVTPRLGWVNLNQVVEGVLELSAVTLRKSGVQAKTDLKEGLPLIYADAQLLEQVLMNLVTNAVQAVDGAEERVLEVSTTYEGQAVKIEVADSGPGIPEDIRDRIFDPFFSIKPDGSGIGLSISHRIVTDHGGTLEAGASRFGGARLTITIPATVYWGYDSHG